MCLRAREVVREGDWLGIEKQDKRGHTALPWWQDTGTNVEKGNHGNAVFEHLRTQNHDPVK